MTSLGKKLGSDTSLPLPGFPAWVSAFQRRGTRAINFQYLYYFTKITLGSHSLGATLHYLKAAKT